MEDAELVERLDVSDEAGLDSRAGIAPGMAIGREYPDAPTPLAWESVEVLRDSDGDEAPCSMGRMSVESFGEGEVALDIRWSEFCLAHQVAKIPFVADILER